MTTTHTFTAEIDYISHEFSSDPPSPPTVAITSPLQGEQFLSPFPTLRLQGTVAGTLSAAEFRSTTGSINTWTPLAGIVDGMFDVSTGTAATFAVGTHSYEVRVIDEFGNSAMDLVSFEVVAPPPPIAQPVNAATNQGVPVVIDVLDSDINIDPSAVLSIEVDANNGSTSIG